MTPMKTIRRVTVYADSAIEETLIQHFTQLGSTGYTVTDCRGKGEHEVIPDPMTGVSQVRIEVLVEPDVAEKIVDYLQSSTGLKPYALAACVDSVDVAASEHF